MPDATDLHEYDPTLEQSDRTGTWLYIQYAGLLVQFLTVGAVYYIFYFVANSSKHQLGALVETGVPAAIRTVPLGEQASASVLGAGLIAWMVLEVAALPLAMYYHGTALNAHGADTDAFPWLMAFSWKYPFVGAYYVWKRRQTHQEVFG